MVVMWTDRGANEIQEYDEYGMRSTMHDIF